MLKAFGYIERVVKSDFFFGKRPCFHHSCATWNEQTSNIKTMVRTSYWRCGKTGWLSITASRATVRHALTSGQSMNSWLKLLLLKVIYYWLIYCLIDCLTGRFRKYIYSPDRRTYGLTDSLIVWKSDQLTDLQTDCQTDRQTDWRLLKVWSINRLRNVQSDSLKVWSIDRLLDGQIYRLTDGQSRKKIIFIGHGPLRPFPPPPQA